MKPLQAVRNLVSALAWFAVAASSASAAGVPMTLPQTIMVAPQGGSPQWTFNVNVAVDHILPQYVSVGAYCQVNNGNAYVASGRGSVERPLVGGAFSGALSVPVYLATGQLASAAKNWTCSLYFKDGQGKLSYPSQLPTSDPSGPKPGTASQLSLSGNL